MWRKYLHLWYIMNLPFNRLDMHNETQLWFTYTSQLTFPQAALCARMRWALGNYRCTYKLESLQTVPTAMELYISVYWVLIKIFPLGPILYYFLP